MFLFSLLLAVSWLVQACLSPTLPLPPPSHPEISAPNSQGQIQIRGYVRGNSEVFAKNARSLEIVGEETDSTGRYEVEMLAEVDDRIIIWYYFEGRKSDIVEVLVPAAGQERSGAAGSSSSE